MSLRIPKNTILPLQTNRSLNDTFDGITVKSQDSSILKFRSLLTCEYNLLLDEEQLHALSLI